jgi:hypothetical protein
MLARGNIPGGRTERYVTSRTGIPSIFGFTWRIGSSKHRSFGAQKGPEGPLARLHPIYCWQDASR